MKPPSLRKKFRWWVDSVHGLQANVGIYRYMQKTFQEVPYEQRTDEMREQLDRQAGMVGHCFLHVILVHPVGSGRFWDDDD